MESGILPTLDERTAPHHTALLPIDMQKDLVHDGFRCDRAGRDLTATRSVIPVMRRPSEAALRTVTKPFGLATTAAEIERIRAAARRQAVK